MVVELEVDRPRRKVQQQLWIVMVRKRVRLVIDVEEEYSNGVFTDHAIQTIRD